LDVELGDETQLPQLQKSRGCSFASPWRYWTLPSSNPRCSPFPLPQL